jgi:hypothetical protein
MGVEEAGELLVGERSHGQAGPLIDRRAELSVVEVVGLEALGVIPVGLVHGGGSFPLGALPGVALVRHRGTRGAAVAVPVVPAVVVGVAGALAVGGQAVERGADLLPVAAAAGLVPARLGAEQRSCRHVACLPGALAGGVAPAGAVASWPGGRAGLVLGGPLAGGSPARVGGWR